MKKIIAGLLALGSLTCFAQDRSFELKLTKTSPDIERSGNFSYRGMEGTHVYPSAKNGVLEILVGYYRGLGFISFINERGNWTRTEQCELDTEGRLVATIERSWSPGNGNWNYFELNEKAFKVDLVTLCLGKTPEILKLNSEQYAVESR